MTLFQDGDFTLHSGDKSDWIIDCGALTDDDLRVLAKLIVKTLPPFERVIGIPRGGLRFAAQLERHTTIGGPAVLLVDDVYTTGASLREARQKLFDEDVALGAAVGVVLFARTADVPWWVVPLFTFSGGPA